MKRSSERKHIYFCRKCNVYHDISVVHKDMPVLYIKGGCPICNGDVRGTKELKFYCDHCNILYDEPGRPASIEEHEHEKKAEVEKFEAQSNRVASAPKDELLSAPEEGRVYKTELVREKGWLYFIDKKGDISRVKMARSRADKGPRLHHKVLDVGIQKEKGYLYYLDKDLDIFRSPMKRGKKYKDKKEKIMDT
ncbi:hypothetical protein ACFLTH_05505 [Bacteroidota bacterium]